MIANKFRNKYAVAILCALAAALMASTSTPFSSLLVSDIGPMSTVAFMNIGVGIAAVIIALTCRKNKILFNPERHIRKSDRKNLVLVIASDFLASVLLMVGLTSASATSASLMLNFEIVTTALIALVFLKEKIPKSLWVAITLITLGCITITSGTLQSFASSPGLLFVFGACFCWGFANCMKKKVAERNPMEILLIRGITCGLAGLLLAFIFGEAMPGFTSMILAGLLGIAAYGASNYFFLLSQRELGAAKSSTIYGINPFLSAVISIIIYNETPSISFAIALLLLIPGFYIATVVRDRKIESTAEEEAVTYIKDDSELNKQDTFFELRNYLTAIGFMLIASQMLMTVLKRVQITGIPGDSIYLSPQLSFAFGVFIFIIGVILTVLRKRDFTGLTFLSYAMLIILYSFVGNCNYLVGTIGIFFLMTTAIFLFEKRKKKFAYAVIFLLFGLNYIMDACNITTGIYPVIGFATVAFLFYISIAASNLLPRLPLASDMTDDDLFSFMRCGSMLGYLIIALTMSPWILIYLFGFDAAPAEVTAVFFTACSVFLVIISVLLLFIGKIRFTSAVFLGTAFVTWIVPLISGAEWYVVGIIYIFLGLFAVLRKKSFLLMSLMFIVYGISAFSSIAINGTVDILLTQVLLNVIPCLIAIYLALAIFLPKRKLPLF